MRPSWENIYMDKNMDLVLIKVYEGMNPVYELVCFSTVAEHKKPEVVTEETAGDYSIHDIVLPLPGWDVTYPQNAASQWYEDMLDKDGLTQESLKHKVK